MVIVGTGSVNHAHLVDLSERCFSSMPAKQPRALQNVAAPLFTSETLFMRDDDLTSFNVGVFFPAPDWRNKHFYAFLLLQRIFGSFSAERNSDLGADIKFQLNAMHSVLGAAGPEVQRHDCIYSPYSDCGIFGHYFCGGENFGRQMSYIGQMISDLYTRQISEVELQRAKQKLYMELLMIESTTDSLQQIGPQMLYLCRRVTKTEIAHRVAGITTEDLQEASREWLQARPSVTFWGPTKSVAAEGTFQYFRVNALSPKTDVKALTAQLV